MVDVGAGVTDVTVYYRNVVRYVATIPMGASAINRDIRTMSVPEKHVESLKQKYGSAVAELAPEDKLIRVNGRTAREAKDILLRNLATVIEARATDIVEFVQQELKDSGYAEKLAYGIVLTGGSAKPEGSGRTLPPRDGPGCPGCRSRDGAHGDLEGEGRRSLLLDGGGYSAPRCGTRRVCRDRAAFGSGFDFDRCIGIDRSLRDRRSASPIRRRLRPRIPSGTLRPRTPQPEPSTLQQPRTAAEQPATP